jgi:hypothetical protein
VLRLLAGQVAIAAVKHRLPAAGLGLWEIDLMPEPPQNANGRFARLRANAIAQARNH